MSGAYVAMTLKKQPVGLKTAQLKTCRQIERKWLKAFLHCPLVDSDEGAYNSDYAYQLFYGVNSASYPRDYPYNFRLFYSNVLDLPPQDENDPSSRDSAINDLIKFLFFIGIGIRKERIESHLEKYPYDFPKLFSKCYFIFKMLAHYGERLDLSNPFRDNYGDIRFLSAIESGESTKAGSQLDMFADMEIELPDLYSRFMHFPPGYEKDEGIQKLFNRIENTNRCFFITGRAGTGKSTFTHYFAKNTTKTVLICAFTGVAAVNVGGQTIHSIFRFPLKPMLIGDDEIPVFPQRHPVRLLIEKTDTIIIDEVSMLRSDVVEALDYSLRNNGGDHSKTFGGKQLLFIGDLFQLPPVVNSSKEVDGELFNNYYKSEYFFDSPSYQQASPVFYEFQKVHRQKDLAFLGLLDKVRSSEADGQAIAALNERYNPAYIPEKNKFVITLTTTNAIARRENLKKLRELRFTSFLFSATIDGDFPKDKFPTDAALELKKGSQVMLVRNDVQGRWVNGTIGKIEFVSQDLLEVRLQDESIHSIERETWENRRYKYDKATKKILSEVIGTFSQYPVKLAWAVTIHKSQGLTFDRVVIDLGAGAFVNGQLYTALSRCRTLEGIVLKRKISMSDLISDRRLIDFYETEKILSSSLSSDP